MSRFGWAYVSSVLLSTGSIANGPTGSLQFHNSSQTLSGSPNLTYNVSSGELVLTGTMIVSGTLYANEYHTNVVSASIIYKSGSTKFGDDAADTHQFTGSVLGDVVSGTITRFTTISGSNITGTTAQFTTISASLLSASSIAGYAIGTNVQAYDATLAAVAGASTAADTYIYFTATDTAAVGTITSFGRSLIDDANNTTARTTLGLGTIATQAASSVAITGGSINNTTIGASTQSTGQFTTLSASSTIRAGGAITGSTITSSNFIGDGSSLTNLTASNITNFTNDVRAQFTPGTNITIVGGVISSTAGGGTPGGADTQVQFNSGSTFSGSSNLTYNYTTNTLSGTTAIFSTLTSSQETIYTINDMGVSTVGGIAATTKTGSIGGQATDANGLFFHPSGTYMYVADNGTDKVHEYSLSTPWDVSTISYTSVTASFGSQENAPHDIFFHPSGTYFYVLGTSGDDINQYSMSPAWSLGSAVFVASSSANGYESAPLGMWFKPDGTSVYIVGSATNTVRQHSITTPWDITTMVTASVVSSYNALGAITSGQLSGISFSDDGKKMYLISSLAGDRRMYEFYLSTAWDVSTVTKYIQHNIANGNNTIIFSSVLSALYRRPDGSNIYFINNGSVDKVVQYDTKNASLSIGDGVLQVNDGLAVFGSSSFNDLMANNIRSTALTTIAGIGVGTGLSAGTTISASSTIWAGGAITGSAGMSISGGPTTIAGGAGQNLNVSTTAIFSGPNANFGATTIVSGSIAKFDTVIGKYATYSANFTVATASYFSGINSAVGSITASLTGALNYYSGQALVFKDIAGNANVNNILIQASGSDTIDSNPSYIINTASGSLTLICNGVNGFYVV